MLGKKVVLHGKSTRKRGFLNRQNRIEENQNHGSHDNSQRKTRWGIIEIKNKSPITTQMLNKRKKKFQKAVWVRQED
jgi:hypothetical protein